MGETTEIPVTGKVSITASDAVKKLIEGYKKEVATLREEVRNNTGAGTTTYHRSIKSITDFGASPNKTDNSQAIQDCFDYCLEKNIARAYVPYGARYNYEKPLLVWKRGAYASLQIVGDGTFWGANMGSELQYNGTDGFALGIQNGKGCTVSGLRLISGFKAPFTDDKRKFYQSSFDEFTDGVHTDKKFGPHAGIVLQPFPNKPGEIPEDGGYNTMQQYFGQYPNLSTQTGGTGTTIENNCLDGFVVGICSSPNGFTRNEEITMIRRNQYKNMKLCISSGQDQEKGNVIDGTHCWGPVHTIFANGLYGIGNSRQRSAGHYMIRDTNFAGLVARLWRIEQQGYFATYIDGVYGESAGRWGNFGGEVAMSAIRCSVDFEVPEVAGEHTLFTSNGSNVAYRDCNFRYYGRPQQALHYIGSKIKFENFNTDGAPLIHGRGANHVEE